MSGAILNDIFVALDYFEGAWLAPFGNSAFIFSIAGALIVRSSLMSKELTDQSLQLKRRSGELRHSYDELREAQHELTRKEQLAAVGELSAVIAHEVRNPLGDHLQRRRRACGGARSPTKIATRSSAS